MDTPTDQPTIAVSLLLTSGELTAHMTGEEFIDFIELFEVHLKKFIQAPTHAGMRAPGQFDGITFTFGGRTIVTNRASLAGVALPQDWPAPQEWSEQGLALENGAHGKLTSMTGHIIGKLDPEKVIAQFGSR